MTLLQPLFSVGARSRAAAILLAAGLVMATAATTLVAVVPLYAGAIAEAGFRSTLAEATAPERAVEAAARIDSADFARLVDSFDDVARRRMPGTLRTLGIGQTDSLGFPAGRYADGVITSLAAIDTDEALLEVVDGSFGTVPVDGALAVSLVAAAADELGLAVGDRLELDGRTAGPTLVELVAIVDTADRFDDLWIDRPAIRDGVTVIGNFTDVGPFLVDITSLASLDRVVSMSWRGVIVPSTVGTADLDALRSGAAGLQQSLRDRVERDDIDVTNGLTSLLAAADTALGSTSAVIAVILVQLVGLALYGLGLAASVLAGSRLVETSLLRSRGATSRQLGVLAAAEALFIAVPAAVLGPVLARGVVGLVEQWGPVAASGLDLDATLTRAAIVSSTVVALVAIGVVTLPAVRSARALAAHQAERTRATGPGVLQRTGADIGIAALAMLALWQLTRSSAATRDLSGRLGTDPVLVFAPTLGVIAASLITLRLIAVFARGAQSSAASGSGLATALAGWELARRPGRTARTSVLVVMSVTVGTFAVVQGSSWERSQRDQADATVSADAVVAPDLRPAATISPLHHAGAYRQVPGVDDAIPLARPAITVTSELGNITAVATDTGSLDDVLRLRSDLRGDPLRIAALQQPVDLGAIPLVDGTGDAADEAAGDLTVQYSMQRMGTATEGAIEVAMLVIDRYGTIHRLEADPVPVDRPDAELRFGLTDAVAGLELAASAPLGLVEIEVIAPIVLDVRTNQRPLPVATFDVLLADFAIGDVPIALDRRAWTADPIARNNNTIVGAAVVVVPEADGVRITLDTGLSEQRRARITSRLGTGPTRAQAVVEPVVLPVMVTAALLDSLALEIGDTAVARVDGTDVELLLTGVVPVVPFAVEQPEAMLLDWSTLVAGRFTADGRYRVPTEWALTVGSAAARDLPRVLEASPFLSAAVGERRAVARDLAGDPFAIGLFGSLGLALVASLLIAVVGLMLTAVVGARERRSSYSVLRAMGASTHVLRRWLLLEIVPLVGLSAASGLVAGVVLARTAITSLTVTSGGARAIPQPTVVIPWLSISLIVGVALAAGIALPLVTGRLLGRNSTADDLRIGDTT